jgi:hypothetical protein
LSALRSAPHDYARAMLADGKSVKDAIEALMLEGKPRGLAAGIVWRVKNEGKARRKAANGLAGGTCVSATLPLEMVEILDEEAERRGLSRHRLTSLILEGVLEDNLVNAVLDDEGAK